MKVKKYTAATMPEAMQQIRKELGPDAVILQSKNINYGGFLGFFKKKGIQVVAALDPNPVAKERDKPVLNQDPEQQTSDVSDRKEDGDEVLREIKSLKKMIAKDASQKPADFLSVQINAVFHYLLDQEADPQIARGIMDEVSQRLGDADIKATIRETELVIQQKLANLSFEGISLNTRIIQFVGPTGVGKTTTIAKAAANMILKHKKKIAFITTDTYRIAAIDQLKTYASILDVPLEIVYTPEDFTAAVRQFASFDAVLVDTAGRNFREEKYVNDLMALTDTEEEVETFLVLSLTAKPKDLLEIYDKFQVLPIKEVIFTKLDETRQFGSLLNITLMKETGIAYLANGQAVPDDLLLADTQKISSLIVGGYFEE